MPVISFGLAYHCGISSLVGVVEIHFHGCVALIPLVEHGLHVMFAQVFAVANVATNACWVGAISAIKHRDLLFEWVAELATPYHNVVLHQLDTSVKAEAKLRGRGGDGRR